MIGMSLLCEPTLVIADEPTTALDVTVQAQIIDLLRAMRAELGMALVLISHDLGVVAGLADRILVMYAGRIVENAARGRAVAAAAASLHRGAAEMHSQLSGPRLGAAADSPRPAAAAPGDPRAGCAFAPRCPRAAERCRSERPLLQASAARRPATRVACHFPRAAVNTTGDPLLRIIDLRVDFGAPHGALRT